MYIYFFYKSFLGASLSGDAQFTSLDKAKKQLIKDLHNEAIYPVGIYDEIKGTLYIPRIRPKDELLEIIRDVEKEGYKITGIVFFDVE